MFLTSLPEQNFKEDPESLSLLPRFFRRIIGKDVSQDSSECKETDLVTTVFS